MEVYSFTFNPFQENTYIVAQDGDAWVVDPGMFYDHEYDELFNFIEEKSLSVKAVVNTHCHIDHIFGLNKTLAKYDVPFYAHSLELPNLKNAVSHALMFGVKMKESPAEPAELLDDLDVLKIGSIELDILFLPGHSPGHVGLYNPSENVILAGDVLFKGSIGRTDLPGGSLPVLEDSIRKSLYSLPGETKVYAGHMEPTSIEEERRSNPFVRP